MVNVFDPDDRIITSDPIIDCVRVVVKVLVNLTKFAQNQMLRNMRKRRVAGKKKRVRHESLPSYASRQKEKKKNEKKCNICTASW